ncbi:MAG: hypothetical protein ACKO6N_03665 [Myxococcota bacterium]
MPTPSRLSLTLDLLNLKLRELLVRLRVMLEAFFALVVGIFFPTNHSGNNMSRF